MKKALFSLLALACVGCAEYEKRDPEPIWVNWGGFTFSGKIDDFDIKINLKRTVIRKGFMCNFPVYIRNMGDEVLEINQDSLQLLCSDGKSTTRYLIQTEDHDKIILAPGQSTDVKVSAPRIDPKPQRKLPQTKELDNLRAQIRDFNPSAVKPCDITSISVTGSVSNIGEFTMQLSRHLTPPSGPLYYQPVLPKKVIKGGW